MIELPDYPITRLLYLYALVRVRMPRLRSSVRVSHSAGSTAVLPRLPRAGTRETAVGLCRQHRSKYGFPDRERTLRNLRRSARSRVLFHPLISRKSSFPFTDQPQSFLCFGQHACSVRLVYSSARAPIAFFSASFSRIRRSGMFGKHSRRFM